MTCFVSLFNLLLDEKHCFAFHAVQLMGLSNLLPVFWSQVLNFRRCFLIIESHNQHALFSPIFTNRPESAPCVSAHGTKLV